MEKTQKFLLLSLGIFMSFTVFGILQEKITKAQYVNPDGVVEYYTYSMTLVLIYCSVNYLFSSGISMINKEEDTTPKSFYYVLSLLYFLSMLASNLALQFINYPTQVVAKSCKPIPVMIFGVLLGRKSYSFKKYVFVGLVVAGIIMFMYKEKEVKKKSDSITEFGIGELLVLSSLFMDGIIAALQERGRSEYNNKPLSMLKNMNKWATVSLAVLWIATKEMFKFISFIQRHPSVMLKLSALSVFGFTGQYCIIMTVCEFGTLPASMVATIRKFFTVLISVFLFGNSLLLRQWIAAAIVFSGLFLDVLYGKSDPKPK